MFSRSVPPLAEAAGLGDDVRARSDEFALLFSDVVGRMYDSAGLPFVLWTASAGVVSAAGNDFSYSHRDDRMGKSYLIIATYDEESVRELLAAKLWFSR